MIAKEGKGMGLFSRSSDIEKKLENLYVPMLETSMGMPPSQAKQTFREMLKKAKEDSQKEGGANLPNNFGDLLLEKEPNDEKIKRIMAKKRAEGVRDEDIKWWWNMHELERRMMSKVDELAAFAMFLESRERGEEENIAALRVRKYHPFYGEPDDTSHASGNDRPLPYELKDRINIYIQKRAITDPKEYKGAIEKSSSFNSLIRSEIKNGNI
jgi:hypothetical protein